MSDPRAVIAETLPAARAPCITSSFQAECVVLTQCCASRGPTSRCSFSRRSIIFRRRSPYRDEMTAKWGLNLINLRAAEPRRRPLGNREHAGLLRAPQGRAALRRARALRRLVHGAAPRSVAVARKPAGGRAVQAAERDGDRRVGAARLLDGARRVEIRQGARHRAAAACTSWATRASAASRARRSRSIPTIPVPAAGRAKSSNAAFTSRPNRLPTPNGCRFPNSLCNGWRVPSSRANLNILGVGIGPSQSNWS